MKLIFSKDIRDNRPFKVVLLSYLALALLFYILLFFLEKYNLGLSVDELRTKILGNQLLFIPAMSLQDIILNIHIKLFLYIFSSLTVLTIFLRTNQSDSAKVNFSLLVFLLIILEGCSLFLIKFVPFFVYLKSLTFVLLQVVSIYLCVMSILYLLDQKRVKSSA